MAPRERFEAFAGCKIKIMRSGQGDPLVYLHGARGAAVWLPFMEKLAQHFDVIVPQHPGYGESDTPEWLDNVGDLAFFYLDAMQGLGLDRVTLVGSSLGGWIAAEIAVRSTARLKALVLSCAAGIHVQGVRKGDIFLWSPEQTARNMFHDPQFAEQALAQPVSEEQLMVEMKNRLTTAKLGWQPRLYNPHLHKWLHRIDVPTLLIWGDDDKVIPPAHGPAFQQLIPGSRLEVIKDCGHIPQVERVDEWVGKIVAFARERRP
jgi:pimeloyl-ACP methyl ester carboxylesterase